MSLPVPSTFRYFLQYSHVLCIIIILTIQLRKLRLREVK